jgi:hypothetical protein
MPRKRLILERIDPESEKGKKLVQLDSIIRDTRAPFLDLAIRTEQVLSWTIALYFCPDEDRRTDLYQLVLHRGPPYLSMSRKIDVLKAMLELSHPQAPRERQRLTRRLEKMNGFRNKIAHWRVDTSDQALDRALQGEIRLVPSEGSAKKPELLTRRNLSAKKKEWLATYDDLVAMCNELLRRASGEGGLAEIDTVVERILGGYAPPWPTDITDLVFLHIERDRPKEWIYRNVVRALDTEGKRGQQLVNQYIGKVVKHRTTAANRGRSYSPRSSLIQSYQRH